MLAPEPNPFVKLLRHPWFKDSRFMAAASLLLPGGSLLAYSHFWETRWLEVTHHRVKMPGLRRPLTLLHLSDLHLTREDAWHRQMIAQVAGLECDLLVVTGDLVMPGFDGEVLRDMLLQLPSPPLGRFLVAGNWEFWSGLRGDALSSLARDTRLTLLMNSSQDLGCGLTVVGVDSELGGQPDIPLALAGVTPGDAVLALTHCPSLFPKLDREPVQLVLSGHTHGGQVRLPVWGPAWLPRGSGAFDQGWFEGEFARLFVTRGFGTSLARVRLRCRPEAALIRLEP